MRRNPISDRIGGNLGLIHLQEGDLTAIRRPEVVAAHIQLFRVHPIHFGVQQAFVLVISELPLLSSGRWPDIEVVFTHIGDMGAIRRKLWITRWLRRGGELYRRAAVQAVHPELPERIE